jgi:hypothetical protein
LLYLGYKSVVLNKYLAESDNNDINLNIPVEQINQFSMASSQNDLFEK